MLDSINQTLIIFDILKISVINGKEVPQVGQGFLFLIHGRSVKNVD